MDKQIKNQTNNHLFKIGTTAYIILGVLAYIFYLERTVFVDISFHLFYIIKDGGFAIQNNRFGAMLTQIFPLIGSKIGLSLSSLMKLYSVGFVLYYLAIFLIITRVLKLARFGLLMLLFSTLMVTDTFYWIQSELPQGIAFLILYFAVLFSVHNNQKIRNWILIPVLATMVVTIVFFNPLLVFLFIFFTVFLYLDHPSLREYLKASFLFYILILIIKSLFFKTYYDSNAIEGVKNFITLFPDYIFLASNKQFLLDVIGKYYLLILMLLSMTYYYISKKNYIKVFLLLAFFGGYLILVNVSYPNGADAFYIENLHLPLSVFVALPFALDFKLQNKNYFIILVVLIVAIRIIHIGFNHNLYTERVNMLSNYLQKTENLDQKKIIISENHFPKDTLLMSWATPYEFWLLSTHNGNDTRSIMITDNVSDIKWTKSYNKKFVTKWGVFDYSELPTKYFNFTDTSYYQIIE